MRALKTVWRFSGSIYFAIALILLSALFVIAGTWIESRTGSHAHAAHYTYSHPLFGVLLAGFFINILVSALLRWPFKPRQIPFLLTHLGLLMIISGVLIKLYFGTQGSIALTEGSGSSTLFTSKGLALTIESKNYSQTFPVDIHQQGNFLSPEGLKVHVIRWEPHTAARWDEWIKEGMLTLNGIPPIEKDAAPVSLLGSPSWKIVYTDDTDEKLLQKYAAVAIRNVWSDNEIAFLPLDRFLADGFRHGDFTFLGNLSKGILYVEEQDGELQRTATTQFCFDGSAPYKTHSEKVLPRRYDFSIAVQPLIIFRNNRFSLIDRCGCLHGIDGEPHSSLYAYDRGFGGYSTAVEIPYISQNASDIHFWERVKAIFEEAEASELQPALPLKVLKDQSSDFSSVLAAFLKQWEKCGTWLCPASDSLPQLDWKKVPENAFQRWLAKAKLFDLLQRTSMQGDNTLDKLKEILQISGTSEEILEAIDGQAEQLALALPAYTPDNALLFSAGLREYGITPSLFTNDLMLAEEDKITLETRLRQNVEPLPKSLKWEDNNPAVLLEAEWDEKKELLWLHLDRHLTGLKVPFLQGKFISRLHSATEELPYRLRLREARRINYPGTAQPFSYEADLWINNTPATISMNDVYETWDGYRFYLSNIAPGSRESLQQVHIVANRDPAKYLLTLPGFFILSLGVLLLLFFKNK